MKRQIFGIWYLVLYVIFTQVSEASYLWHLFAS